jgi:hypothetical protein
MELKSLITSCSLGSEAASLTQFGFALVPCRAASLDRSAPVGSRATIRQYSWFGKSGIESDEKAGRLMQLAREAQEFLRSTVDECSAIPSSLSNLRATGSARSYLSSRYVGWPLSTLTRHNYGVTAMVECNATWNVRLLSESTNPRIP